MRYESPNVSQHPEWRRLLDHYADRVETRMYPYDELSEAAGINVRTTRGRQQFLRFAIEVEKIYHLHFENERDIGYRVVEAKEHGACSTKRLRRAKRQTRRAKEIASRVDFSQLNVDQVKMITDIAMRCARIEKDLNEQGREIKKIARATELGRLPHPLMQAPEPPEEKVI